MRTWFRFGTASSQLRPDPNREVLPATANSGPVPPIANRAIYTAPPLPASFSNPAPLQSLRWRCALSTSTVPAPTPIEITSATPWTLATRIAFRFCFVYFGLYCLSTQILTTLLSNPGYDFPDPSSIPPWKPIINFTATHIFHHKAPLVFTGSGSGDKTVDFVLTFCLLLFSILTTVAWSVLDRRRTSYCGLHKWFLLFVRFALAGQMLVYGFDKAVPLQMPFPGLFTLIEPFGNMSLMGVLWSSVGAAQPYEIAAGCVEILGGLLLFFPRTITLGALISLADMTYVFILNMTYDVPVKLFSFQLILLALILLAPQFRCFADFFLLNRATQPAPLTPLFRSRRANRIALAVGALYAVWLIAMNVYGVRQGWKQYGPGAPRPALYGIWNVEQFTVDGQTRPPLLTDTARWRRILFEHFDLAAVQQMNDAQTFYNAAVDPKKSAVALTGRRGSTQKIALTFTRPSPDQLILDGPIDGHPTHIQLRLEDRNHFLLVSRGFHWIQEYPFNR